MIWIDKAREYLGIREIKGRVHNQQILDLWKAAKLPFTDDETPWCAGFANGVLEQVGIRGTRSGMARSFLHWGKKLTVPVVGCVVVLARGAAPSGHVGFVVAAGKDRVKVLGGNQGDAVSEVWFSTKNVLGYRWPPGQTVPGKKPITQSKIATTAAVAGAAQTADLATQVATTLQTVQPVKDAADSIGLTQYAVAVVAHLGTSPRFWLAVAVLAAAGAIWYWRRKDH